MFRDHRFRHFRPVRTILAGLLALMPVHVTAAGQASASDALTVFAAASLKTALDSAIARFEAASDRSVIVSYAGTQILARQIEHGAPADIMIAADEAWMDYLADGGFLMEETRSQLVGNRLVIIAAITSDLEVVGVQDLPALVSAEERLALANSRSVPAGRYARAALEHLGVWSDLAERLVEADNVRTALSFVARGEAPIGIVYATDALVEPQVKVIAELPASSHPPIRYPVGAVRGADAGALDFLDFLRQPEAQNIFRTNGFAILEPGD